MYIIWWILLGVAYIYMGIISNAITERYLYEKKEGPFITFMLIAFFPVHLLCLGIMVIIYCLFALPKDGIEKLLDTIENKIERKKEEKEDEIERKKEEKEDEKARRE